MEASIFDEGSLAEMKSVARFKLLHIGLRIVESVFQMLSRHEEGPSTAMIRAKFVEVMLKDSPNFKCLFVRNVQTPKNQLHEAAKEVKKAIIVVLNQVKEACLQAKDDSDQRRDLFLTLLKQLFGPNSLTHFSPKKN